MPIACSNEVEIGKWVHLQAYNHHSWPRDLMDEVSLLQTSEGIMKATHWAPGDRLLQAGIYQLYAVT